MSETENTVEGRENRASETESTFERWGSFTADKTYSYDEKYYAVQEVEYDDNIGVNETVINPPAELGRLPDA